MVIGFVLGVIGIVIGVVGAALALLSSLVGGTITVLFIAMLVVGAMLFSPVFLWLALGLAVFSLFRGLQWLKHGLRG